MDKICSNWTQESRMVRRLLLLLSLTTLYESTICEADRHLLEINGNHHHTINDFGHLFVDEPTIKPDVERKRAGPNAASSSTQLPDDFASLPPDVVAATQAPTEEQLLRDRKKTSKKGFKSSTGTAFPSQHLTMMPTNNQTSFPSGAATFPTVKSTKTPKRTSAPTIFATSYDSSKKSKKSGSNDSSTMYPSSVESIVPSYGSSAYPKSGKMKSSNDYTHYPSGTLYPSETLSPTDFDISSKMKGEKSPKYDQKKTKSPSSSTQGKGKGSSKGSSKDDLKLKKSSKGIKSSKKKKGDTTYAPSPLTILPSTLEPTISSDDTNSPSAPGPSTNATTSAPTIIFPQTKPPSASPVTTTLDVRLTDYALLYTFEQTRIPQTDEVNEVVNVTQSYLDSFFEPRFDDTYQGINTEIVSSRFLLNQPFELNLTSIALFSSNPPSVSSLDMVLVEAFTGSNLESYLLLIAGLPDTNIFSTTTEVFFESAPILTDTTNKAYADRKSSNGIAIGTSVAAGTLTAFLVAFVVSRRFKKSAVLSGKDLTGHLTVADDTYRGDSTIFSGTTTTEYRRQTRFAENTRFGDDADEYHSLAGRSEWALSTLAISEVDSEEEDDSTEDGHLKHQLFDEEEAAYLSPLTRVEVSSHASEDVLATPRDDPITRYRDASDDDDDVSEDEDVPMRVVDLIKRFSPPTFR